MNIDYATPQVIDNFLPKEEFKKLQDLVILNIPYFFQPNINSGHTKDRNDCYLTHVLYNYGHYPRIVSDNYFPEFKILSDKLQIKSLIRMKLNLYPRTDKLEKHMPHTDYSYSHKACIFSFNTCDGGTILHDGRMIESVENRALLFDASYQHSSTSCTNEKARFNLNINFI